MIQFSGEKLFSKITNLCLIILLTSWQKIVQQNYEFMPNYFLPASWQKIEDFHSVSYIDT